MTSRQNSTELFSFVEKVTNVPNSAVFLKEITAYLEAKGKEGGIAGITKAKFKAVQNNGGSYQYELSGKTHKIHLKSYSDYHELRTDDFAALIYAVGYIELFAQNIPDSKGKRFELFRWIFKADASRFTYMSL